MADRLTRIPLNRLSDLLFVVSRVILREARADEVLWRPQRGQP